MIERWPFNPKGCWFESHSSLFFVRPPNHLKFIQSVSLLVCYWYLNIMKIYKYSKELGEVLKVCFLFWVLSLMKYNNLTLRLSAVNFVFLQSMHNGASESGTQTGLNSVAGFFPPEQKGKKKKETWEYFVYFDLTTPCSWTTWASKWTVQTANFANFDVLAACFQLFNFTVDVTLSRGCRDVELSIVIIGLLKIKHLAAKRLNCV